jgi:lambda family phage tail tape measure protein
MATIDKYVIQMDVQGQQSVDRLQKSLGGLKSTIAGIGFATFIAQAFQAADAIGDVADATGIAAGQVGALANSLKLAGGDAKDVGKILTTFYGNLEQAASGSEKAQDALGKVGIKLGDLTRLSEGQLLNNALASLAQMEAGAARTAAGVEIFGKAFRNIDPTKLQQILDTQDVAKFQQEYEKAGQVMDNLEANFTTLQKAVVGVLTPIIGETDNFRLSLEQAETVVKTLGAVFAAMFAVKTVGTIVEIVRAVGLLTNALKGTVIVQTALTALSGPRGWAIIAAGAATAAAAVYGLNKALEGTNDEMKQATGGQTPNTATPSNKPAFAEASKYSKEELQARKQALTTAQQTTQQQLAQNKAAQDYQRIINTTIGMQQDEADAIKLNAQLQQDADNKILDLTRQIEIEKSKGRGTNQAVILELEKQKQQVLDNLVITKQLKTEELGRLQIIKDQVNNSKMLLEHLNAGNKAAADQRTNTIRQAVVVGALTEEQAQRKIDLINEEYNNTNRLNQLQTQLNQATAQGNTQEANNLKELMNLERERYTNEIANIKAKQALQDQLRQSEIAGAKSAIEAITRSMDPYQVALMQVNSVWSNMGTAVDRFVDGSTMKFSDLAKSIIRDLVKIQLKAQASKIFSAAGSFLGSIFGFAEGGEPPVNKPSIVGEKGPELFVPKSAGTIIPNNKLAAIGAGGGGSSNSVVNYITNNNVSAIDGQSVARFFAENRRTMLGSMQMAQKELPYGNR